MDQTSVLAIGGLSWTEYLVIAAILLLLFGARKLPELAHSMGSSIQSFKKGMRDGAERDATPPAPKDDAKNGH